MAWKVIILTVFGLALVAFASAHPWIFGASVAGFAGLFWIAYKLDKLTGIR